MRKNVLNISVILLLALMGANGSYFVFLKAYQIHLRFEANEELSKINKLQFICVSKQLFSKKKNSNEISIGGSLFDIAEVNIGDDSVQLLVYHDEEEESIVQQVFMLFDYSNCSCVDNSSTHFNRKNFCFNDDWKILNDGVFVHSELYVIRMANYARAGFLFFPKVFEKILLPPPKYFCVRQVY